MASYSFRELIIADLRASHLPVKETIGTLALIKHLAFAVITRHHFACVFYFRINVYIGRRFRRIGELIGAHRYYIFANDISFLADIGPGLRVHHTSDIVIGRGVRIGKNLNVYNGVTLGCKSMDRTHEVPMIGDNVLIGTGAKVLGRISVGDNAIIGALTFCDKDVPPNTIAVGNPMRFLGTG